MYKTLMLLAGLGLALLLGSSSTALAQGNTGGTVTLESKSMSFLAGVNWNDGTLEYQGRKHAFTVDGLSALDLLTKISVHGEVKNLKKLEDFNGTYTLTAAPAGGAAAAAGTATLKNQYGVEVDLTPVAKGTKLTAPKGVEIKLKN